jgi:hypothetical protein
VRRGRRFASSNSIRDPARAARSESRRARAAPAFLLAESQTAPLLSRQGCLSVRVPLPERFAVHKLITSRLRPGRDAKSEKDILQACVLAGALAESHPGAIASAVAHISKRARSAFAQALTSARRWLEHDHPRAWEELRAER